LVAIGITDFAFTLFAKKEKCSSHKVKREEKGFEEMQLGR